MRLYCSIDICYRLLAAAGCRVRSDKRQNTSLAFFIYVIVDGLDENTPDRDLSMIVLG